jgi:mannose-6-phosphate isomerase-like protein (cupin superfamily)
MIRNVRDIPIAVNICEQVLREVEKQPAWSMAHVIMNPLAASFSHNHEGMTEIYVVTKGYGELESGALGMVKKRYPVVAGSVHKISVGVSHMLRNKSAGHLEHLVFAFPPFDPEDVHLLQEKHVEVRTRSLFLPKTQDCFDGAKILSYAFPRLDMSIAFGWVINDLARRKQPHYHKKITEWVFVVEGRGYVRLNGTTFPIESGDWIRINPATEHALINEYPEDLVVVCVCFPMFQVEDVHYCR